MVVDSERFLDECPTPLNVSLLGILFKNLSKRSLDIMIKNKIMSHGTKHPLF